jgi:hypothetical protein
VVSVRRGDAAVSQPNSAVATISPANCTDGRRNQKPGKQYVYNSASVIAMATRTVLISSTLT